MRNWYPVTVMKTRDSSVLLWISFFILVVLIQCQIKPFTRSKIKLLRETLPTEGILCRRAGRFSFPLVFIKLEQINLMLHEHKRSVILIKRQQCYIFWLNLNEHFSIFPFLKSKTDNFSQWLMNQNFILINFNVSDRHACAVISDIM